MNIDNQNYDPDTKAQIIPRGDFQVLVTEEDKTGEDLLAMSDFFNNFIDQLSTSIRMDAPTSIVPDIPVADMLLKCVSP